MYANYQTLLKAAAEVKPCNAIERENRLGHDRLAAWKLSAKKDCEMGAISV
jgi:hypothetical protein